MNRPSPSLRPAARRCTHLAFALTLLVMGAGAVTPARADDAGSSGAVPQMSPEEMQKMMAAMQPGPNHELVGRLAGKWKAQIRMWMGPGDPQVSEGTATYEWVLGGRYLVSHQSGSFAGMAYEGMGIDGYDNGKQEFFSLWMDNMGTGVMHLTGQKDPDGHGWTLRGSMYDPSRGREVPVRETMRLDGKNKYTFTMYDNDPGPDGQPREFKAMEISATRQ